MVDYADYEIDAAAESEKNEVTFFLSAFADTAYYTDLQAFAVKLRDLILMEAGTNPAAIDMGVGIRNYLFEFLDDETLQYLNQAVNEQQRKYLPSELIKRIEFNVNGNNDDRNKLYIFVYVNNDDQQYSSNYFAIGIGTDASKSSELVSQIYI